MSDSNKDQKDKTPVPPGSPDQTPVKEPNKDKKKTIEDPNPPEKKIPRV